MSVSQYQGCLVGCALGDAIGAPVERWGSGFIQTYIRDFVDTRDFSQVKRASGPYAFGQYTDDTQLTRELALSLVEQKTLDLDDYGRRLVKLFESGAVGSGQATRMAVAKLAKGHTWQESGTPAPAEGNGSAMRAAPIGLFYWDSDELRSKATDQSFITHRSDASCAGSVAVAKATSLALVDDEDGFNASAFVKQVAEEATLVHTGLGSILFDLSRHIEKGWDTKEIHDWVVGLQPENETWPGISPWVVTTVLWSLYAFVSNPDDYMAAITRAISPGGDVDTTAAITGAISGARLGVDAIPAELSRQLNDKRQFGYEFLCDLGERLYTTVWDQKE